MPPSYWPYTNEYVISIHVYSVQLIDMSAESENLSMNQMIENYRSMPLNYLRDVYFKTETNPQNRDAIMKVLTSYELVPEEIENGYGLYPAFYNDNQLLENIKRDPALNRNTFIQNLMKKSEYAYTKSSIQDLRDNQTIDVCKTTQEEFEITPVQQFVANFIHPRTPYYSMLLYHGVGVGKTCAAITAAEAFLDMYPRKTVFIVCPKNIRPNFEKTIFDISKVRIYSDGIQNESVQCTGNTYLELTGTLEERDSSIIEKRVRLLVQKRYRFLGYSQFANFIKKTLDKIPPTEDPVLRAERQNKELQRIFNGNFLIIDEAHNLRDTASMKPAEEIQNVRDGNAVMESEEDIDTVGSVDELSDNAGGKKLTPYLQQVLEKCEGMKFLLMTATPMFNDVREILFLLNLLLSNDKRPTLSYNLIFDKEGRIKPEGKSLLGRYVRNYISYMRGENPFYFPLRLSPGLYEDNTFRYKEYPTIGVNSEPLDNKEDKHMIEQMRKLKKLCVSQTQGSFTDDFIKYTQNAVVGGIGYSVRDTLLQSGNVMYPGRGKFVERINVDGFQNTFVHQDGQYATKDNNASWLFLENLPNYSPKMATILEYIQNVSVGLAFVYSRFLKSGALLMALILEANGYSPWGRDKPLLRDGIQHKKGKKCALCPEYKKTHPKDSDHEFTPAKYILLTGDQELSPDNRRALDAANQPGNAYGKDIKVVLGSQITAEGMDFKNIREVHILEAWFHLNKTEQIVGRGIRFKSHCNLPPLHRNCSIYLHALTFPKEKNYESMDLYSYRMALRKAIRMGEVNRVIKVYALDCNLRRDAAIFGDGFEPREQIDSQGEPYTASIQDQDGSPLCDYDKCSYTCNPDVPIDLSDESMQKSLDPSTFSNFSAKFFEGKLRKVLVDGFTKNPYQPIEVLQDKLYNYIPMPAVDLLLQNIVNNKSFTIKVKNVEGYIIYKNKYLIFQPEMYQRLEIPLSLRMANHPIKRDQYTPISKNDLFQEFVKNTTKPVENTVDSDSIQLWTTVQEFIQGLKKGNDANMKTLTNQLIAYFNSKTDIDKVKKTNDSILNFISKVFLENISGETYETLYRTCLLEYFWDEWISNVQKMELLQQPSDTILQVGRENILSFEEKTFRFMNVDRGSMEYVCKGEPCKQAFIDYYEGSSFTDPLRAKPLSSTSTGLPYGFLVAKSEQHKLIFKSKDTHDKSAGQECTIVSNPGHSRDKLVLLLQQLKSSGHDFLQIDLTSFKNVSQSCTLLNLVLRMMNALEINGKQWFYRPIRSYINGLRSAIVSKKAPAEKKGKKGVAVDLDD